MTAFADAVVTLGAKDELNWIVGDRHKWNMPATVLEHMRRSSGRSVAFISSDEQSTP
jgi:hypothetical protein